MTKLELNRSAIVARLRRHLSKSGQTIRSCRADSRHYHELGDYFIADYHSGLVVRCDVDLEALANELGVLKPFEKVAV